MEEWEWMDKPLRDLIDITHFTENVSVKIHGLLDETEIYRTVKDEFAQSKRYTASILLLTDDGSKLRVVETSIPPGKLKSGEKAAGLRLKGYKIDLNKSSIYSQAVREGKTVQVNVSDIVDELFPRPLADLISKTMGYEKRPAILTPLKRHGKIIGALAMTSTELAEHFIPSVRNLAQHISTALELANEYAERVRVEEELRKYRDHLEELVEERTAELIKANKQLQREITERKRAEEQIRQRNRELVALNAIATVVSQSLNLDEILNAALDKVLELMHLDVGGIYLADPERRKLDLVVHRGISKEFAHEVESVNVDEKTLEAVMAEGKLRRFILSVKAVLRERAELNRILSAMKKEGLSLTSGVPVLLQAKKEILGLMTVASRVPRQFSEAELQLLTSIGQQIATAIENARLYEQVQARSRYLETLQQINATLRNTLPLDEVLETIARGAGEALGYMGSLIVVPDTRGERLTMGGVWGSRFLDAAVRFTGFGLDAFSLPLTVEENPMAWAYLSGGLQVWSQAPERIVVGVEPPISPKLAPVIARAMGAEMAACVPLPVGDKVVGVLTIFSPREQLPDEERAILLGLADQAGLAIQNAQLYQAAQQELAERKRAQEALRASENRYRTLFEKSPASITLLDKSGVVIDCNESTEKLIGYSKEEIIGEPFEKLPTLDPKDLPKLKEIYEKLSKGLEVEPYELEIIRKDGTRRWINIINSLLTSDDVVIGFQIISRDITERKRAERALRESEEKFRNLAEQSPNMIFIHKKGKVVYANEKCEEIVGYRKEEFYSPGFDFRTLIAPESMDLIEASFSRHMKGENLLPYEYALVTNGKC